MDYIMQEMPDMHKTGEKKFYPKVRHLSCLSNDFIMKAFMETTMMKRSAFEGVLRGLPEVMNTYLSLGHSVKIDGFGTFNLILGQLSGEEMENTDERNKVCANLSGVYIKKINFLPEKEWLRNLRRTTELNHVKGYKEMFGAFSTTEERLQIALAYIEKNGYIKLKDYMDRTGLGRRKAEHELDAFCNEPESGIRSALMGKSKVYVKR